MRIYAEAVLFIVRFRTDHLSLESDLNKFLCWTKT